MMKINEKNLVAHATSFSPIDKEGYLNKKGENNRNFQRRYFILKGNLLFYFDKKGDKEPVGVIILEGCTIEIGDEPDQYSFQIVFHGPNNRSYVLGTDTHNAMEEWMKALACASYDYMKLMVEELQRELDGLDDSPTVTYPVDSPIPPPRQRHNPFNKPESSPHQRSYSMRTSSNPARFEESRRSDLGADNKVSITFRELHNAYGRQILKDYNVWKNDHRQALEKAKTVDNLISF